jgi:IS5 family transposase
MNFQLGVDSHNGLAHSAVVTPANVHDKYTLPQMRHEQEKRQKRVYGDNAYRGGGRRH